MRVADVSMVVAIGALTLTAVSLPAELGDFGVAPAQGTTTRSELAAGPTIADDDLFLPVGGTDVDATSRGVMALEAISYDWRRELPEWEIRFHAATEGAYGYTLTGKKRIDIYVRPEQSEELLMHVIAHELGHAVDVTKNDGDDRRRWLDLRGIEDAPWWPDNRAADFATGAGDFAESFAAWQVGEIGFRSELGDPPTPEAQALLAELSTG